MESQSNMDISGSNGAPGNSRWNPTKEQISMLESLYRQGIRTPSAEQIQQITSRLKAYGQIEGKNVFYWFQNHKARQRQKQKQENLAYMNHFLHQTQPLFPPPYPNVVYNAYYLPQPEVGYYPQYEKVLLPGGLRRRGRTDKVEKSSTVGNAGFQSPQLGYDPISMYAPAGCNEPINKSNTNNNYQETLPLFPLHPTGILQGKTEGSTALGSLNAENFVTPLSSESSGMEEGSSCQTFYDFFSTQGPCESE